MRVFARTGTPKSTKTVRFVGIIALTGIIIVSVEATRAQEPDETNQAIETIEVVGSYIRGIDPEGFSTVLILDRPAIERTGAVSVAEVLQQLPMNSAGTFNDRNALSSALGGTGISFRGMGANSVLILINGRRATSYGFSHATESGGLVSFVDLNNIPVAAVERIEILKDGASALYGSDAMAGVINIVLRKDFTGTELEARLGAAADSGAEEQAFNALFGWSTPRTSVHLVATFTKREQLSWSNRAISASANHEDQGGLDQRSLVAGSLGIECEERNMSDRVSGFVTVPATGVCLYDPNTEIVVPSAKRAGLMALVSHELTPNVTLQIEASYLSSEAEGRMDSVPWTGGLFPASNPWNPFGLDVLADYRFSESGSRINVIETENVRTVVALEGEIGEWNWDFAALHHSATTRNHGEGYLSADRIEQALDGIDLNGDGTLQQDEYWNLFSPASNPNSLALTNSLAVSTFRRSQTTLKSYTFKIGKDFLQMRTGIFSAVFGLEYRTDSVDDESDSLSLGSLLAATPADRFLYGIGIGVPRDEIDPYEYVDPVDWPSGPPSPLQSTGSPSTHGSLSRNAVFAELRIPLLSRLEMQAALRYEDITNFGEDISPKLALRFNRSERLRARASWSKSFRAPSPGEMYQGPTTKLQGSWDPKRCPAVPGWVIPEIAGGCVVSTFVTSTWGNPDLDSEKSESVSVGIEVEVSEGHEASMDCWKTEVYDKILTAQTAWIIRHEDDLPPGTVIRDPLEPWDIADGSTSGLIAQVNVLPLNFGKQEVKGCDIELGSDWETPDGGQLQAQLLGTHLASNKLAFATDDPLEEMAGTYGYPENRANLNLFWHKNDWQLGLYGRWTDGFEDTVPGNTVASHTEWDTQISYSGLSTAKFTVGVENLFDEAPPFSVGDLHPQGFPVQFYNMRGRFIYVQATISLGGNSQASRQQ